MRATASDADPLLAGNLMHYLMVLVPGESIHRRGEPNTCLFVQRGCCTARARTCERERSLFQRESVHIFKVCAVGGMRVNGRTRGQVEITTISMQPRVCLAAPPGWCGVRSGTRGGLVLCHGLALGVSWRSIISLSMFISLGKEDAGHQNV